MGSSHVHGAGAVWLAEARVATVQAQLDALAADKADVTLVTQYTGQVADVFEQLATTVADSTQASIAQLMTQQQEVRLQTLCMHVLPRPRTSDSSVLTPLRTSDSTVLADVMACPCLPVTAAASCACEPGQQQG
jgi:hypothetical protein